MQFHGNIDLLDNEIRSAVMQAEGDFPANPKTGRIIFKNKRVLICVEITAGLPVWVPLTNELNTYIHNQVTPATTWSVIHNLNTEYPVFTVYDDNDEAIIPEKYVPTNASSGILYFSGIATEGRAAFVFGADTGTVSSVPAYEHNQTTTNTAWVITHNLGYNPVVRVFIGSQEVQPASINHNSTAQLTITFSVTQVGIAKLY